jgi:hypothetical protein
MAHHTFNTLERMSKISLRTTGKGQIRRKIMPRSISRRQSSRDGVRNSPLSKVSEILSF